MDQGRRVPGRGVRAAQGLGRRHHEGGGAGGDGRGDGGRAAGCLAAGMNLVQLLDVTFFTDKNTFSSSLAMQPAVYTKYVQGLPEVWTLRKMSITF